MHRKRFDCSCDCDCAFETITKIAAITKKPCDVFGSSRFFLAFVCPLSCCMSEAREVRLFPSTQKAGLCSWALWSRLGCPTPPKNKRKETTKKIEMDSCVLSQVPHPPPPPYMRENGTIVLLAFLPLFYSCLSSLADLTTEHGTICRDFAVVAFFLGFVKCSG